MKNVSFDEVFKRVNSYTEPYVQDVTGMLYRLRDTYRDTELNSLTIDVFPGSFNPLHDAHKKTFELMGLLGSNKFFELCVLPLGKDPLTKQELSKRLKQFVGLGPVIISSTPRMVEKIGLLREEFGVRIKELRFHVGMDTLDRMVEDYSLVGISGLNANFIVYNRYNAKTNNVDDLHDYLFPPINCFRDRSDRPLELLKMSSTELRKGKKRK